MRETRGNVFDKQSEQMFAEFLNRGGFLSSVEGEVSLKVGLE